MKKRFTEEQIIGFLRQEGLLVNHKRVDNRRQALSPGRASGKAVTGILDRLALVRGLPQAIRTDNGKEFCGKDMLTWAHERGVRLFLIQPPECIRRIVQRALPGRVPERALVHQPGTRSGGH
jgi:transposase InsO family protein